MGKTAAQDKQEVLAVYLGTALFGIPIAHIQGVLETPPLTHVPLAPPEVKGVMNLRGRVVTAVDLWTRLSRTDRQNISTVKENMSVIIENGNELYSLLVDRVGDVHSIPLINIDALPLTMNAALKEVSSGVFQLQDKIMIILDPSALLNTEAI